MAIFPFVWRRLAGIAKARFVAPVEHHEVPFRGTALRHVAKRLRAAALNGALQALSQDQSQEVAKRSSTNSRSRRTEAASWVASMEAMRVCSKA